MSRGRLAAIALLTLLGASTITFGFIHLAPMDPARFAVGFRQGNRGEDQINRLREWYGLDQPVVVQYARYMRRVLVGDFGTSLATRREIGPEIVRRLPWSLLLAAAAALLAWPTAAGLAVVGARGGAAGRAADAVLGVLATAPAFLVAMLLVYFFAVRMILIPILPPFELDVLDRSLWIGLVMPALSVAFPLAGVWGAQLRAEMGTAASRVAAGRALGLAPWRALRAHAFGVAARAVLARPLPALGFLFSALLIVEEIFNWPGLGRSFTRAVVQRDLPVVQAILLVVTALVLAGEVVLRGLVGRLRGEPGLIAIGPARGHVIRPRPIRNDRRLRAVAVVLGILGVAALAAPVIVRFPPDQVLLEEINLGPSLRHWLGTDASGRDLFSRLLFASRVTLGVSLAAALLAVTAGVLVGLLPTGAAWGRSGRRVVRGAARVLQALPALGLALAILSTAGREMSTLVLLFGAMGFAAVGHRAAGLIRAGLAWPFVQAAVAAGAGGVRIAERHLAPHLGRALLAAAAGLVPTFVLLEATLGFMGFSVTPTTPSWGTLLWRSREALHRGDWWQVAFPLGFVALAAWGFSAMAAALARPAPPTYVSGARVRLGREWGAAADRRVGVPAGRVPARPQATSLRTGPDRALPGGRLPGTVGPALLPASPAGSAPAPLVPAPPAPVPPAPAPPAPVQAPPRLGIAPAGEPGAAGEA